MVNVTGFRILRSERIKTDDAHFSKHSDENGKLLYPRTVIKSKGSFI